MRRGTEQKIWEEILLAFQAEAQIDLAYPIPAISHQKMFRRISAQRHGRPRRVETFIGNELAFGKVLI